MDKLKLYMALLTLNENNLRVLHWKVGSKGFHTAHERYSGYYEQLGTFMDETAEQMITLGMDPVGLPDVIDIVRDADNVNGVIIPANHNFDVRTADVAISSIFSQLYELAAKLADEDDLPVDVQDVFMGHAKYFRVEGLYKLGRANLEVAGISQSE